ncbi:hypothetical protein [Mesorhizobium sp. 1B3]|uniref:hypothetical protein n=1 Tax=Mesorhizobium sp. 1B3 TaxID=3243599 RepID=UPI003D98ACF0
MAIKSAPESLLPGAHLSDNLERARSRLEDRFLEGGAVLARALDSVSEMINTLDRMMAALGKDAVEATISDIGSTNRQLASLPQSHSERQASMRGLAQLVMSLQQPVDNMLETLRYLCTLAVSMKITGAGATAFSSFADEMVEKIQYGRSQVDDFSDRLEGLVRQVRQAGSAGEELQRQYENIVPKVTNDLTADAQRMTAYYGDVMLVATQLAGLVRQVQGKVARVLSALQIGDVTRQRVEHVLAGLNLLDRSDDAVARSVIIRLLSAQMEDLLDEFIEGCSTITSSLAGLAGDSKQVIALGKKAGGDHDGGMFMKALQQSLTAARQLVGQIETSGRNADEVRDNVASVAGELSAAVGNIRAIRNEIQYMTINTSLRCSRMGDVGKPMNVIATELRVFAEQMEAVSESMLERLEALSKAASDLGSDSADLSRSVGSALDNALATIGEVGGRMEDDLGRLIMSGDRVARDIMHGVSRLDFTSELGDVLEACTLSMIRQVEDAPLSEMPNDPGNPTVAMADEIFATYTMARERDIHRRFLPAGSISVATSSAQDTVELADCLF